MASSEFGAGADAAERADQTRGLWVIAVLAVLTIVEFLVFVAVDSTNAVITLLLPIALGKAWLIVDYFMHVSRLWRPKDHGE